ncbi:MAG: hypothetical protein AB1467_01430 [Candidatus Diapherotrites archaeon]
MAEAKIYRMASIFIAALVITLIVELVLLGTISANTGSAIQIQQSQVQKSIQCEAVCDNYISDGSQCSWIECHQRCMIDNMTTCKP